MEDTLGDLHINRTIQKTHRVVLILVLMEDTLGDAMSIAQFYKKNVLILVLMEDTLGDKLL